MGYPKAVMTFGLLSSSYPYVSANIEEHDKNNLKAKWGKKKKKKGYIDVYHHSNYACSM